MDKPEVSHYQQNSGGEPIEYIKAQGWLTDFACANIIKYVSRARYKGEPLNDYKKARQYLDWLIGEQEESETVSRTEDLSGKTLCSSCSEMVDDRCDCYCPGCMSICEESFCSSPGCECANVFSPWDP